MSEERKEAPEWLKEIESAAKYEVPDWMKDGLELRYIFKAINDFMNSIRGPLKDLVDLLSNLISGERLGKEVGAFYKNLVDNGVPEDQAIEMTRRYFESRIAILESLKELKEILRGGPKIAFGGKMPGITRPEGGHEEKQGEKSQRGD